MPRRGLADKDFLYQQRVWFMRRHPGVCTGCSVGCSIWIEENQDHVYRLKPRENPHVNKWWICNPGRYGYHHIHDEKRLVSPRLRREGSTIDLNWHRLPEELRDKLAVAGRFASSLASANAHSRAVAALLHLDGPVCRRADRLRLG